MEIKNEYLIIFKKDAPICPTLDKFKSLLNSHKDIECINKNKEGSTIKFKSKEFKCDFSSMKQNDNNYNNAINYRMTFTVANSDFEVFKELLRTIRVIVGKWEDVKIITLHDDIAKFYCIQGYPIVFDIENLMRKLIYQIMNINKGYEWHDTTIPDEVKKSVKTDLKRNEDFFHNVDFIQLSNFLFKPYSETNDLVAFLHEKDKSEDKNITLADLEPYRPKSNWDRYFKGNVDVEGGYLKKCWERLYDIRCAIAHCREITKEDFEQLQKMSQEVSKKLNKALSAMNRMDDKKLQELAQNIDRGISMPEEFSSDSGELLSDYISSLHQAKENLQKVKAMLSEEMFNIDDIAKIVRDSRRLLRQWLPMPRNLGAIKFTRSRIIIRGMDFPLWDMLRILQERNYDDISIRLDESISMIDKELNRYA